MLLCSPRNTCPNQIYNFVRLGEISIFCLTGLPETSWFDTGCLLTSDGDIHATWFSNEADSVNNLSLTLIHILETILTV